MGCDGSFPPPSAGEGEGGRRRHFDPTRVALILCLLVAACAPATPSSPPRAPEPGRGPEPLKSITIAQESPYRGFAPWFMTGSGRVLQFTELHANFLVSTDAQGRLEGRLAARLPSLDDGTIELLPDGRMRTVWRLRPDARWHDGAPVTANDIVFAWNVSSHPEIPVQRSAALRLIESVDAPDANTAVITYQRPFYKGIELGFRELYPLPSHLLAEAFQGDKEAFVNLPFWTTEYVHAGPFRVVDFGLGENVVLERFDDYFRGRPKIHRITLRIIRDHNTIVSNLLAGTVDVTAELATHLAVQLRDDWKRTDGGYIVSQQGTWRFTSVQFSQEWGGPRELQRDVRLRRGLLLGIDRDAIRIAVAPGFEDTDAETFMPKSDPRGPLVGRPFARYRYDPAAATRELADGGWRRGADGRALNAAGQTVQLSLRTTLGNETELSAVASNWRDLGIEVVEDITPPALARDNEYAAKFPNLEITAQGSGESSLNRFDGRLLPTSQNRFSGSNGGSYVNPAYDRLIDQLYSSLREQEQATFLREAAELLAAELPALPMYFTVNTVVALKHVRGFDDFGGSRGPGQTARNAHLWDRD